METLKNDLKKIMSGSAGLVKGAGPLQVPSWRFPEKMAISLDIEEVLKRDMKDGAENHNLLLELIIDRCFELLPLMSNDILLFLQIAICFTVLLAWIRRK